MFGRVARYVGGAVMAWIVFTVQGALAYLALLAYALITDTPSGGPLAGPFMVLIAAVLGAALIPLLYAPTLLVVELASRKVGPVARLLLAGSVLTVTIGILVAVVAIAAQASVPAALMAWLIGAVSVILPASAAGAIVYGGSALANVLARLRVGGQPTSS
ncbi:hypothetical protein E0H26_09395 [Micromonospora zingiberis]|uniref:Uncharacterized protein n=1 Tax=Micromonospora zingiberis TaxID=2053011 RepID=A0A4R0GRX1_9ACTN|nr:hypothetical protein [Micromonospora zingiberis]TCB98569.1 hypothetical protein E0H26_09395 [Micromonospora zingiberis]